MPASRVTPPQPLGMTTTGACALCNRTSPRGSGFLLGGAAAFGVGLTAALVSYYRQGLEAVSGQACAVAMAVGGALLVTGLMRGVKTSRRSFALGKLVAPQQWLAPGSTVDIGVVVMPDHTLHLLEARLELQAVETIDDSETVLRSKEVELPLPPHLRERAAANVKLGIPPDWPVTMESPGGAAARRTVTTRIRAIVDTEAHPVLHFEAPLRIAAKP